MLKETLRMYPIVPVVAMDKLEWVEPLGRLLLNMDLPLVEITFRTPQALPAMALMKELYPSITLGAGTVTSEEQIDQALNAGVDFLVSPGFSPRRVAHAQERGIPMVPGINNPSLAEQAMDMGLDILKFYPAEISGGLAMIQALHAVYPDLHLMPTGGVKEGNLAEYLAHPAVLACGGSWLVPKAAMAAGDWQSIEKSIRASQAICSSL